MKKKKMKKILAIGMMFIILYLLPISCQAADTLSDLGDLSAYGSVSESGTTEFKTKIGNFLGIFQMAGSAIAVISLICMGIAYMMGSIEEKAKYKKTLFPYFIGAMMVFGLSNLLNLVYLVVTNLF